MMDVTVFEFWTLTVSSAFYTDETIQICLGDSYHGYSLPGVYRDTLQASGGCDSVVTLQLNVMPVERCWTWKFVQEVILRIIRPREII